MNKVKLLVAAAIIAVSFTACEKECVKPVRIERPVINPGDIQAKK